MSEVDNILSAISQRQNSAVAGAIGSITESPDDAARAVVLSQSTGVPAPVISGDLEGFERQHKATLAGDIVRNNPLIAEYLNRNPMAAKLSNDDYGNLDAASMSATRFGRLAQDLLPHNIFIAIGKGAAEGVSKSGAMEPLGSWISPDDRAKNRLAAAGWTTLAAPIEIAAKTFFGTLGAIQGGIYGGASQIGGEQFGRDIASFLDIPPVGHVAHAPTALEAAKPWFENGKEPPRGVHAEWDKLKSERNDVQLEALNEALKESTKSLTRERSPEMFAEFMRDHLENGKIGINAEGINALYGDKVPTPDDGILGWVPGIEDQLRVARETGGDVQVPIADWLARVEPEVARALQDDIRVSPGNITKREKTMDAEARAALPEAEPNAPIDSPLAITRSASALEPMFSIGDRKLALQRLQAKEGARFGPSEGFHDFTFVDENGNTVGSLNISAKESAKELYVEEITGVNGLGPRDFGPSLMLDLKRQLKAEFPWAEWLVGHRVSGAREKLGTYDRPSAMVRVRLDNPAGWDFVEPQLREVLQGGEWQPISPSIDAYYKPWPLLSAERQQIATEVDAIIKRLAPSAKGEVVESLKAKAGAAGGPSREFNPAGAFVQYRDQQPLIAVALDGVNPQSTAFHEALHHLRREGFLRKNEWSTLEAAAKEQGWIERVKGQYPNADQNLLLEEAIARGFQDWYAKKDSIGQKAKEFTGIAKVDAIFRKMQELFDTIKAKLGEILGREPTMEDLFEKIDTGEIGRRKGAEPLDPRVYREAASSDALRNWFGASKVVDEQGQPLVVHHGTGAGKIDEFKANAPVVREGVTDVPGIYFTGDKAAASGYAVRASRQGRGNQRRIESAYLKIENPLDITDAINNRPKGMSFGDAKREALKAYDPKVYDGVIFRGDDVNPPEYIVQRSEQVKSIENQGSFDPNNPNIRLSIDEVKDMLRANTLGLDLQSFKRIQKLIEQRHTEDVEAATKRALKEQTKLQSDEWRKRAAEMRPEVVEDIKSRPSIAADLFLNSGELFGQKFDHYRILRESLTKEQEAALPDHYMTTNKLSPTAQDIADATGHRSVDELIASLNGMRQLREQSKKSGDLFRRALIDAELQKRMEAEYGLLEKNIMEEAKDQALSETQLKLLGEEYMAAGMMAKAAPIDADAVRAYAQEQFSKLRVGDISSDRFLDSVGRNGRDAERALIAGKPQEAVQFMQRKFFAATMAKQARELEDAKEALDKTARRFQRSEVKGIEPEFTDHIQSLLLQAGYKLRATPESIARGIEFHGTGDLSTFVAKTADQGWDPVVADWLGAKGAKPVEDMTAAEFGDFKNAIDSLNHIGREINKIEIAGAKQEFAEFRAKVLDNITQLPARSRESQGRWLYNIDASLTRMEELVKDLDLRKELGPLWDAVIRPMMLSKSKEYDLMTELSNHFKETRGAFGHDWRKSLGQEIHQDVIYDPYTKAPYDMTKENLLQIMLNWGNRSNIEKYVDGAFFARFGQRATKEQRAQFEGVIKALIDKHATAEDWQFVQRMWEPFKGWQRQMDVVARNTSGVAPKWIEVAPVDTPHGQFEGGYWPVKYDRLGSNIQMIEDRAGSDPKGVFDRQYFRAATSKGYLKERTGYVDFVDISTSIEQAAGTMQQTIHDIAFRDALIQASKVFYDSQIRGAIRKHYGQEYEAQLIPWLKRISYQYVTDDQSMKGFNDFLRRTRMNLVGHSLPLNLKVILSPDVGVPNPMSWARYLSNRKENMALALEKSAELRHLVYNLDRDYTEALNRAMSDPKMADWRKKAIEFGYKPVAAVSQEFRAATWIDNYNDALARGRSDADAIVIADAKVRQQHGAASVVDLPSALQSNEAMKMLTVFQGYFNTMYNWQREMPGQLRRGEYKSFLETAAGSIGVGVAFGALLFNQQKKDDSWFKTIGKALVMQPLSTIPILNSATNYVFEGFSPRMPFASLLTSAGQIFADAKKISKGERPEKGITHTANVIGLSTGLPLAQIGRTAQFGYDVAKGYQRPRNIGEYARGIITGEARLK